MRSILFRVAEERAQGLVGASERLLGLTPHEVRVAPGTHVLKLWRLAIIRAARR